ncbi:MAG: NADH-quinone oxidoreductase subunit M [Chloroflexota bacterium]
MLSVIVFLPLVGAIIIALFLREARQIKYTAALFAFASLVLSFILFPQFDLANPSVQFAERHSWIPELNVQYFLGVDGLSLPLVILTTILGFCSVLVSWHIKIRPKEYFAWLLILETSVLGVFSSLDFLLFFLFWEIELVPMFMLISIWGSAPPVGRREYSAMKFLIYTILGSAFMLVGILVLYFSTGTFDMIELGKTDLKPIVFSLPAVFFLLFAAYAIKLPVWPVHTWLPDAHTDAPTAVSVMLAGVLLKMGGYGMIRVCVTILPDVAREFAWLLAILAVINVLYGAATTMVQTDLKRLIAYSSVSHMGYVLLGIAALTPVGLTGASMQMFTHGTITGLLFALVGLVYDRAHTRQIPQLGGLASKMPIIAVVFLIAGLASLGLPSTSGFVAELLVFLGTFPVWQAAAVLAAFGVVLTAGYILWMVQRVFFGPENTKFEHLGDVLPVDAVPLFILVAAIMVVGIYPSILTNLFHAGVMPIIARLGS